MLFSPVSEAIILFAVPAVFWHVMLLQYAGRAGPRQMMIIGGIILLWTAYAWLAVLTEFDRALVGGFPGLPLIYILLAAFLGWWLSDMLLGRGVPQQMLIALQLFRPLGMVFFYEYLRGTLPGSFAIPAGWGDLLAGLTAAAVLIRYPTGPVPRNAVLLVATVGLIDFTSAVFFGFTSSATPVQLFAFDQPNQVLQWPLGLIPVFLVPYAVVAHILSLVQLRRDRLAAAIG
jgi:hypothetical protein